VCFLVGFLALGLLRAAAQDAVEERYQKALQLWNTAKIEDAYELLQQVEKERPGYKETQKFLNIARSEIPRMYATEKQLFDDGVASFDQRNYDDAKQKFEQAAKRPLKYPKYRTQIEDYRNRIAGLEREQQQVQQFDEGVRLYNQGDFTGARSKLNPVAQGTGSKANEARDILKKIRDYDDCVRYSSSGQNASALTPCDNVARTRGPKAAEAVGILNRIKPPVTTGGPTPPPPPRPTPEKKEVAVSKPPIKPTPSGSKTATPPETPTPVASEKTLRAGLQAYFQGNLEEAERSLSDYLSNNGQKQALAYFFRGAAHSTRYFLSGKTDSQQKELAVNDFHAVKQRAGQFQPPQKYVSPKILALYSEAVGAP
jgi:outer membrane protein assembly factor BamD (BamD/ComL family)